VLVKSKSDRLFQRVESHPTDLLNLSLLQTLTEDVELSRIPLKELCPICFADGVETGFIAFDGNFQITTLGTRREKRDGVCAQDLMDKRIFVGKELTVCTKTSEADCRKLKKQKR
jgi:hypothetical protein